ncbi:type I-C CRISPR-associated protein Cas8c/Csd1 [Methylobacterium oryzihabitans]|uniref:Type I-C CRISPR-associated protein Cas8c/Csd1 n=1 Tax=Methylobacterium oryzihabitans TaxID=2499852 RepID=A0A3S2YLM2_9HYPH|nr:type I-C CRISPR-associated protein Cas8c/Csd1 [Methylobacterium oryzihabitans]RVU13949.1 type I-C CRISPR-associated protein Cas8c/Csd1 [Methylobacterium oryzihabitans]
MTVLQALDRYYDRMAARGEAEAPGFSREKIGYCLVLAPDGSVVEMQDMHEMVRRKRQPRLVEVPAAVKRTAGILPNRLWDKTAYVLGRTAGPGRRTAEEHAAFKTLHRDLLAGTDDPGLLALARFLETWDPAAFDAAPFEPEMLDANVVFALAGERRCLHERPAARLLVASGPAAEATGPVCLVTGKPAAPLRLHPTIKGVEGAQSSGAALVSFNKDAFTSYGKLQGDNAPVSAEAGFRYGAALNRLLDRHSRNRLRRPLGDATVVFWADTSATVGEDAALAAEDTFASWFDPAPGPAPDQDAAEAALIRDVLAALAAGRPVESVAPKVAPGTRFHVLGLAPNAARLSVRFWLEDSFEVLARRLAQHHADLALSPRPRHWGKPPSIARLLVKTTALQEKFDTIPPLLAGEVARAVLSGTRYPRNWLAAALMRLRAGDDPATGWHAAAIRACLARDLRLNGDRGEIPVSLDKDDPSPAYQLGRLFAALEAAQRLALGRGINATIRDRYFGAASATPASVFPLLLRGAQNHVGRLRKDRKDYWIEREIGEIVERLPSSLPRVLRLDAQGRFAIGYYHQRQAQFASRPALASVDGTESGQTEDTTIEDSQDDV